MPFSAPSLYGAGGGSNPSPPPPPPKPRPIVQISQPALPTYSWHAPYQPVTSNHMAYDQMQGIQHVADTQPKMSYAVTPKPIVSAPAKPTVKAPPKSAAPANPVVKSSTGSGSGSGSSPSSSLGNTGNLNTLWNQVAGQNSQASGYEKQVEDLINKGFSYNPQTDPAYQALVSSANAQGKIAGQQTMEDMNDRGILNSTITADQVAQVRQKAMDAVTAQIPTLEQAAYTQYQNKVQGLMNLWNTSNANNQFNLNYALDLQKFNTANDQWNKQFAETQAQDQFNNGMATNNYNLNALIQLQNGANAMGGNSGMTTAKIDPVATQTALANLLQNASTPDAALAALNQYGGQWVSQGASITDILTGLDKRWPGFKSQATSGGGSLFPGG